MKKSQGRNVIHVGDSADVMKGIKAESIQMILTSPPYDDLRKYKGYTFDFEKIAAECYRVLDNGGVMVWVVGDAQEDGSETGTSFRQALHFIDIGFRLHDTMIYMKAGPSFPSKDKYYQVFEYMFVLSKGAPRTFNPLIDRENRWAGVSWSKTRSRRDKEGNLKVTKKSAKELDGSNKFGVRMNIWQFAVGNGNHGDDLAHEHPAPFPEALAEDHILSWSNPGDLILDPFAGSGTTLKMAKMLGRDYVGIDVSPEYADLARRRVNSIPEALFAMTGDGRTVIRHGKESE